jgi:uncharacterized protein YbjT (DUF2867 family)
MLVLSAGNGRVAQAIAGVLAALPGRKRFAPAKGGRTAFAAAAGYESSLGIDSPADREFALADAEELVLVPTFDPKAIERQMALAKLASQGGVRRIHVVSLAGADARSQVKLLRWLGLVEREVLATGLRHTILRCGPFMQAIPLFSRRDAGGRMLVGPFRDTAFPWIDAEDAAGILAAIIRDPAAPDVTCQLCGPEELSFEEVARLLSVALQEPVRYVDVCLPEAQGILESSGFSPARIRALTEYWDYMVNGLVRASCCDTARRLLGRPPHTLAQYFERSAATPLELVA